MSKTADLIIRNGRVLTMDPEVGLVNNCDVAIADGEIIAIGPDLEVPAGCSTIEADGNIVMPGLVDTHTHLWNGMWRTYAESAGPSTKYGALGLGMGPLFSPEDSYQAVLMAALEMVSNGITTVHNWAHNMVSIDHAAAEISALKDVGIRARFSYGYHWNLPQNEVMPLDNVLETRKRWEGGLVRVGMALRNDTTQGTVPGHFAALSVDPAILKQEMSVMRENDIPITMHIRNPGPASYFIDAGYIAPDTLIVHGYHWAGSEWDQLAKAGIRIAVTPDTCMRGLKKFMPIGDIIASGAPLGLSFDHMNGSGHADMFRLMHMTILNEAMRGEETLPALKAVELATAGGAEVMGLGDVTGTLTVGKRADVIMLNADALSLTPLHDIPMAIANSAHPALVDTVIIDGKVVKKDGALCNWDAADVARQANATFEGLRERYEATL